MKIENTSENRLRFVGLYYGQKVLYVGGKGLVKIGEGGWNLKHPDFFLQLKPLETISDEDAINIGYSCAKSATTTYRESLGTYSFDKDYLRSKGYALPWLDLTVQDLIDYGWIKLTEQ